MKEALTGALAALEFDVSKDKDNTIEAHKRRHIGVVMSSGGEKVVLHLKEQKKMASRESGLLAKR